MEDWKYVILYMVCKIVQLNIRASKGFDGGTEAGEASRMVMRQMTDLNLNAEDNLAYAA